MAAAGRAPDVGRDRLRHARCARPTPPIRAHAHPRTGDLYCLAPPATRAHAITRGIPHDADAHFSPAGDALAFRSDAGLGFDNVWVMPWSNCSSMALASQSREQENERGDGAGPAPETPSARARRLRAEGRTLGPSSCACQKTA